MFVLLAVILLSGQFCFSNCLSLRNNPAKIRLSHEVGPKTLFWPGNPSFQLTLLKKGTQNDGTEEYYYASNKFSMSEHGGTHMDAPSHFSTTGWSVDQVPDDQFMGEACVVDAKEKAKMDPDYLLQPEDLQNWEESHGLITPDCVLMINFGWAQKYPNRQEYFGSDSDDPTTFHFPGISRNASKWLAEHRVIRGIGVDTASTDFGQSKHFHSHRIIAAQNWVGYENLNNLDKLRPRGFLVLIAPLKLVNATGAPVTIFAFDSKWNVASKAVVVSSGFGHIFFMLAISMFMLSCRV